ncbi:MAG TPA: DUF3826 domain-containing protein [Tepidisphaeraceae bacterium]|nr:DUF3826 domain-containing protein [Tepidisphaeraceae bacterium]
MKNHFCKACVVVAVVSIMSVSIPAWSAKKPAATQDSADQTAAYAATANERAAKIVKSLKIEDEAKAARVRDAIAAQYIALNGIQTANEAAGLKPAQAAKDPAKQQALKNLHEQFIAKLEADLAPEQVEQVKDGMTANKVRVTYDAYNKFIPNLTGEENAKIMGWLKEARELALDAGSMEAKSEIFNKYKGRINNYLASHGKSANPSKKPPATRAADLPAAD